MGLVFDIQIYVIFLLFILVLIFLLLLDYMIICSLLVGYYATCIPVNPPPFRGSLPHKSPISHMDWVSCAGDINLPHTPFPPAWYPPNKKSSTIKSWPTFCDQYFWKFPIWNSCADEKRREIKCKWYPVIDLFDTFTVTWIILRPLMQRLAGE